MAKLTYNTSRFTNVDKWDSNGSYKGITLSTKINQKNGQDYKLLDVIDIDFNKAWFAPTHSYISNADEFFTAIESLDNSYQVTNISNQLQEVIQSYLSKEEFNSIMGQYQGALIYGDHIAVDENNVIFAYDIISNSQLYEFSTSYVSHEYLEENVYTKTQTYDFVTDKIYEIIGGADDAFDTIQEISEWIMEQTSFEPVQYSEIDLSGETKYYHKNPDTGKYESVTIEYIQNNPTEQYYIIASTADEIDDIYEKIAYINDVRIGNVTWSNELGYSYSGGILKDINELRKADIYFETKLNLLQTSFNAVALQAELASEKADNAYTIALESQELSNLAYEMAKNEIEKCDTAYEMAYYSFTEVGVKSADGYFRPMTDEEKETTPDGTTVYRYYEDIDSYAAVQYRRNITSIDYLIYVAPVQATGMHKNIEEINYLANTSLYNLNVDNSNAFIGYMTLTINPESYSGDPSRTLSFNATQYQYNYETITITTSSEVNMPNLVKNTFVDVNGDVHLDVASIEKDGVITAYQMNEIISNIIGWDLIKYNN